MADQLNLDAVNRATRVLLVGLTVDVGTAVAVAAGTALTTVDITSKQAWVGVGLLIAKTATSTVGSFLLRRFGDASKLPTPLPPADAGI